MQPFKSSLPKPLENLNLSFFFSNFLNVERLDIIQLQNIRHCTHLLMLCCFKTKQANENKHLLSDFGRSWSGKMKV